MLEPQTIQYLGDLRAKLFRILTMKSMKSCSRVGQPRFEDTCVSSAILFCRDLAFACSNQDLFDLFNRVCPSGVRQARVYRGRFNQSMGYGFVELFAKEDLSAALDLNGHALFGRGLR